ncbi:MAG: hypothetical protein WC248_04255, partial [Candidatus Methanomethylophilaceae archaeon]
NMLSVVDRAMVSPVAERVGTLTDLIDSIALQRQELQSNMATQLKLMIDMGNWNGLIETDPIQAQNLWRSAGFVGSPQPITEKAGFSAPYYNEEGQLVQTDEETGQVRVIADRQSTPSSYREWELAGQPGDYATWLQTRSSATKPLTGTQINNLASKYNVSESEALEIAGYIRSGALLDGDTPEGQAKIDAVRQEMQKSASLEEILKQFTSLSGIE